MGLWNKKTRLTGPLTEDEVSVYHRYGKELQMAGCVTPIVMPSNRLMELRGDSTMVDMALRCRMPERDLAALMDLGNLEPTVTQLLNISRAYDVSVMWLLGYHTSRQRHTLDSGDQRLLTAITKRNSAEATLRATPKKSFIRDFYIKTVRKRIMRYALDVQKIAADITMEEHLPLSDGEVYQMAGQPVWVEFTNGYKEWGLVIEDGETIVTETKTLQTDQYGVEFLAYLTPAMPFST